MCENIYFRNKTAKRFTSINRKKSKNQIFYVFNSFDRNSFPSYLSPTEVRKAIVAAMCIWEQNSRIRFHFRGPNYDANADIRIQFGRRKVL